LAITWRFSDKLLKELKEEGKNHACGVKEVLTLAFGLNCIQKGSLKNCKNIQQDHFRQSNQ
jgi:hypothetical protein